MKTQIGVSVSSGERPIISCPGASVGPRAGLDRYRKYHLDWDSCRRTDSSTFKHPYFVALDISLTFHTQESWMKVALTFWIHIFTSFCACPVLVTVPPKYAELFTSSASFSFVLCYIVLTLLSVKCKNLVMCVKLCLLIAALCIGVLMFTIIHWHVLF